MAYWLYAVVNITCSGMCFTASKISKPLPSLSCMSKKMSSGCKSVISLIAVATLLADAMMFNSGQCFSMSDFNAEIACISSSIIIVFII